MKPLAPYPATIASLLAHQALRQPAAIALLAPGREPLCYADLHDDVRRIGSQLRSLGVAAGARVAVALPNGPEMASACLALAANATCVPLNPASPAAEFRFCLQDTRAQWVLLRQSEAGPVRDVVRELGLAVAEIRVDPAAPAGRFELVGQRAREPESAAPCAPHDTALLLHTSGTTARPKLVPLSQANLMASAQQIAAHLALAPADRCLNVMPLFHIHGLVGALLASLAGGASVVCTPGFDEREVFDWIARFDPSWTSVVPTMLQALLARGDAYRHSAPNHRFRFVRSASAALPAALLPRLEALLRAPVVEAYGMTEAAHQMASNPVAPQCQTAGSVGVSAGAEIVIMDKAGTHQPAGQAGEIAVRGPGVMRGYENNPAANAEAFHQGWFRTGDLGHLDAQGRLFISGRLKEVINRGGEKIAPREVDNALLEHPEVAHAVAFGLPHPSLGEDLAAAVVRRAGSALDEAALRAFLLTRLAAHKVPSQIVFVHSIPAGASGKVRRDTLCQVLGAALVRAFVAPRTARERAVEQAMREVLQGPPIGLHDNFFAIGGDSLRGARVMARINRQFGLDLPATDLFRHPSVAALVATMQAAEAARTNEETALRTEIEALSDEEVERLLAEADAASTHPPPANPARPQQAPGHSQGSKH